VNIPTSSKSGANFSKDVDEEEEEVEEAGDDRQRKRTRLIASSLYTSLASAECLAHHGRKKAVEEKLSRALRSVGYAEEEEEVSKEEVQERSAAFTVSSLISSSYAARLRLDENLALLTISERPLSWVHCTLLDGRADPSPPPPPPPSSSSKVEGQGEKQGEGEGEGDFLRRPDVRFLVSTYTTILPTDPAYGLFYPNGTKESPITLDAAKRPRVAEHILKSTASKISMVRHVEQKRVFASAKALGISASISSGMMYESKNLVIANEFLELSLHVDPTLLKRWLRGNRYFSQEMEKWAAEVAWHVLEVAAALETVR
jgi:hypothetical protein